MGIRWMAASFAAALITAVIGDTLPLAARAPAAAQACTYEISPSSVFVAVTGATLSVSVTASGSGCAWTASSNSSFITIVSGATGNGNGTVVYTVAENNFSQRLGSMSIAGKIFVVTQAGIDCDFTLTPSSIPVGIGGSSGHFTITIDPRCGWSMGRSSFVSTSGNTFGQGTETRAYTVQPNVRSRRTGSISISSYDSLHSIAVEQDGRAVRNDFTGDGQGDIAVFRPSSGTWIVQGATDAQFGQAGDIPVPGDYDGDRIVERAVYRPSDATWRIANGVPIQFGEIGDLPVPADYDGNLTTDIAVFRTFTGVGQWHIRGQGGPFVLGQRGDIPVVDDYDGDGKADLAVFRPTNGTWYVATAASGFATTTAQPYGLGGFGDVPLPGDRDGDGKADLTIYRPGLQPCVYVKNTTNPEHAVCNIGKTGDVPIVIGGNGADRFLLFRPSTGEWIRDYAFLEATLGGPGDIPISSPPRPAHVNPTDFDGDGASDMTIFSPSTGSWNTRLSTRQFAPSTSHMLGQSGDVKVPGDYDGDRKADYAVWRPGDGTWHLDFSSGVASRTIQWGLPGDVAMPADYDGDGRTDLAVWRPADGVWYILDSSSDYQTPRFIQWGLGFFSDVPVPGDFDGDGKADLAVFRPEPGLWYLNLSSGSVVVRQWGLGFFNDIPLVGDFDGDGRAELTVYRPAWGLWYSMDSLTGVQLPPRQFGLPGDVPLVEDFDADGITDLSVYRPSDNSWYTFRSTLGFYGPVQWGGPGDEPLLRQLPN